MWRVYSCCWCWLVWYTFLCPQTHSFLPKILTDPPTGFDLPQTSSGPFRRGYHPGNLFHQDFTGTLSDLSEHGLMQWLNSVFAPCIIANSANPMRAGDGQQQHQLCVPGTPSYCDALEQARALLRRPSLVDVGQRIECEVDEEKILPAVELSFRVDKGTAPQ